MVGASIRNTGDRAADEVVQRYVHDVAASTTRPVRGLKAFQRVALKPGEEEQVTLTLTLADLLFVCSDLAPMGEPSRFRLCVAPSV